jgi:hypothetical protein
MIRENLGHAFDDPASEGITTNLFNGPKKGRDQQVLISLKEKLKSPLSQPISMPRPPTTGQSLSRSFHKS